MSVFGQRNRLVIYYWQHLWVIVIAYPGNILYKQGMLLLQNISFCREISAILQLFVFTFQPEEKKRRQKEIIEM